MGHSPLHEHAWHEVRILHAIYSMHAYTLYYSTSARTTLRKPRVCVKLERHYLSEATSKVFAGYIHKSIYISTDFRSQKASVKALNFLIITLYVTS